MDTKNIYQRLAEINKEVKAITKSHKNTLQNFNFRGIDDVMVEIHDLFAKYEVFTCQNVLDQKREERPSKSGGLNIWSIVTYEFTFYTTDGSSVSTQMVGEAMDSGDKGNNKCVSVAFKYAILDMFSIPTKESIKNDPDASSTELGLSLTSAEIDKINSAKNYSDLTQICKNMKIAKGEKYGKIILGYYNTRKQELGGEI